MAGRGPAPSPNRRRRNHPARGDWTDLPPLREPVLPQLPDALPEQHWSPRTVEMWSAWREDPVTAQYTTADIAYAVDTAYLHNAGVKSASLATELRLRMDSLGLTPKGKRDLRWRVDRTEPTEEKKTAKSRRRIRAVEGEVAHLTAVAG